MMRTYNLEIPITDTQITEMRAGDKLLLSGSMLVARDQAHLRLIELMKEGRKLPIELSDQMIFYAGPSPTKPGQVIGSVGPTTAARMDKVAEPLFERGVKFTIGKGERSAAFQEMVKKYKAPYLAAMGGAGALVQQTVKESKIVAFEELGPEAIYQITVKSMPVYVAYDVHGNSIYRHSAGASSSALPTT